MRDVDRRVRHRRAVRAVAARPHVADASPTCTPTTTASPRRFVDDRDAISYLYTSGTTSFPKGVVGSHTAIYLESLMVAAETGIHAGDRIACLMPLFHTAQLNGFGTPSVMMGATQYLMRGFDPDALLDLIERERITRDVRAADDVARAGRAIPSIASRDLSSLRKAAYAMAPMPDALLRTCIDDVRVRLLPRVRADRDEPGDDVLPARAPALALRRGRHAGGQRADRHHVAGRRVAAARRGGRDRLPRPAGAQRVPEATRRRPRRRSRTAGSTPATPACSPTTACSGSATGTRTSSRPVARTSPRSRSRRRSTRPSPDVAEVAVIGLPHQRWTEAITAVVVAKPGATLDDDGSRREGARVTSPGSRRRSR